MNVLYGAQGRNRTADTRIFRFVIFQRVILLRIGRVRAHLFHPVIFIRFITFSIVSRWHGCCTANVPCTLAMNVMGYWLRHAFMSTHLAAIPRQSKVRSGFFYKIPLHLHPCQFLAELFILSLKFGHYAPGIPAGFRPRALTFS